MRSRYVKDFNEWRQAARPLLAGKCDPAEIQWLAHDQTTLFKDTEADCFSASPPLRVPPDFLKNARLAACHTSPDRWGLLYRILWRLTHGERHLLEIATDPDISRLNLLIKGVRRDIHKMHAFVRFNSLQIAGNEHLWAWYEPQYQILETGTPFFMRRFGSLHWKIITPEGSATWNLEELVFNRQENQNPALNDQIESLWQDYYASIFNPARIKMRAMMKEMPVRQWKNLPESRVISQLVQSAPARLSRMRPNRLPAQVPDVSGALTTEEKLQALAGAAACCTACPLFEAATQVVFGEGPANARVVFVGEQPGDEEDLAGHPFIGPAGKLLDSLLTETGIDRDRLYVTNAVKHFKYEERGKRRLHKRPDSGEIHTCRSWLTSELQVLKPVLVVCLGTTAAQSVLGRAVKINEERGVIQQTGSGLSVLVTAHPSSLLRIPDSELRQRATEDLKMDLLTVKELMHEQPALSG